MSSCRGASTTVWVARPMNDEQLRVLVPFAALVVLILTIAMRSLD